MSGRACRRARRACRGTRRPGAATRRRARCGARKPPLPSPPLPYLLSIHHHPRHHHHGHEPWARSEAGEGWPLDSQRSLSPDSHRSGTAQDLVLGSTVSATHATSLTIDRGVLLHRQTDPPFYSIKQSVTKHTHSVYLLSQRIPQLSRIPGLRRPSSSCTGSVQRAVLKLQYTHRADFT